MYPVTSRVRAALVTACEWRLPCPFAQRQTHGHFTHCYAVVWRPYLIGFVQTLGRLPRCGDHGQTNPGGFDAEEGSAGIPRL